MAAFINVSIPKIPNNVEVALYKWRDWDPNSEGSSGRMENAYEVFSWLERKELSFQEVVSTGFLYQEEEVLLRTDAHIFSVINNKPYCKHAVTP